MWVVSQFCSEVGMFNLESRQEVTTEVGSPAQEIASEVSDWTL
jgi:hypothetical protein